MLPTKTDVKITGDLGGEKVKMTIDQASAVFLANMFIDMYSDPWGAVVREYSTNAFDSHIEAGQTRPIEVTIPSDFKPFLIIKDYGVGLDGKGIRDVYSRYGASTKRESNEQNGMLGIGGKSALTATNQFNVIGIKDGIKTYVSVSRASDGSGTMEIISESETDEPNGVEIVIPATRHQVEEKVRHFFRFWKPGTVLVNGVQPDHITGEQVGDFLFVENLGRDYVVMGNVAYPIGDYSRIFTKGHYGTQGGAVAWVGMGDVNFTPSREALHMTELTKSTLATLRADFHAAAVKHFEEKIAGAATHADAARAFFQLEKTSLRGYAQNLTYKGQRIPIEVDFNYIYHVQNATTTPARWTRMSSLFLHKSIILYGYDKEKIHSTHRQKLKLWISANNKNADFVYWTNEIPGAPWTDDIERVHWDDIAAMKLPRNGGGNGGVKQEKYDVINSRGYRIEAQDIDTSLAILFASPTEVSAMESKDKVASYLVDSKTQFVLVNKNQWKTFKETYPKAKHFMDEVKEKIADYQANLTDAEKFYLRTDYPDKRMCAKLDAAKVDDPEIKRAIEELSTDGLSSSTEATHNAHASAAEHWNIPFQQFNSSGKKLFDRYPLINIYGYYEPTFPLDHVYVYLNGIYNEFLKNDNNN